MAIDSTFRPIINRALSQLGKTPLESSEFDGGGLTEANAQSKTARLVAREFDQHLDAIIEDHPWKLFTHRVALDVKMDGGNKYVPEWGFNYAYDLPDGTTPANYPYCLRLLEINDEAIWGWNIFTGWIDGPSTHLRYKMENRLVLINIDTKIYIRYLGRPANANNMTGQFKELFSLYLASRWCESMTAADGLFDRIYRQFVAMLQEARTIDSMNSPQDPFKTTTWIGERIS